MTNSTKTIMIDEGHYRAEQWERRLESNRLKRQVHQLTSLLNRLVERMPEQEASHFLKELENILVTIKEEDLTNESR